MTERHPGEVAMVTKGADDDFGPSRALQHTYMFTQVCRNRDEHSGTVHNHDFIPGQFVNASYDVSGCIKVWSMPPHHQNVGLKLPLSSVGKSTLHVRLV